MVRSISLLSLLLLLFPAFSLGQVERVAVLVGVNVYPKPGFVPLKYAERDVESMAAEFQKLGFSKVVVLKGSLPETSPLRATKANILAQIDKILLPLDGDDTCIVMFSGHGLQFKPPGKTDEDAFFCPVDAIKNKPETLLSLNHVIDDLLDPNVGHKLLIVDACRDEPKNSSQPAGKGIQGSDKISLPSKTAVFFSCSAKEESFETDLLGKGSGTFTYCLLDGLRGGAADQSGQLTWSRLVAHVEDKMESDEVRRLAPRQHPVQAGNGGRVVLGKVALIKENPPPVVNFTGKSSGEARELAPGSTFHWCPPGQFTMGTPEATNVEAAVEVTLTKGFWLSETEVMQGQFVSLMNSKPWDGYSFVKEGADYAASYVSYDDAVAYCEKLTSQERAAGRLPPGWKYALPTEAQWEYACRAGTKTVYGFGDSEASLGEYAWYDKNAWDIGEKYAHEVGKKKPNPWGLKDMHGNVYEWCSDWYGEKLSGGRDPIGASSGSGRVYRGGCWSLEASSCRSAFRSWLTPDIRRFILGFRVAGVPSSE